ncbi:redoxin family protein [Maritalea sp.]|jgi:peroxiredoxin|uniref:redoxin family protein n=1 Tax=Maritalea sp. TaxID=2003361 RepID=UPI0039E2BE8C
MPLAIGDKLPSISIKLITPLGAKDVDFAQYAANGTSVLFCVPAAFSTTCHNNHLPGYIANAEKFAKLGINRVACLSVNDHFVMSVWAEQTGALGKIDMIADGNAELAIAVRSEIDARAGGMGTRFARLAYIVKNGVVADVFVETAKGSTAQTGADNLLQAIEKMNAAQSA